MSAVHWRPYVAFIPLPTAVVIIIRFSNFRCRTRKKRLLKTLRQRNVGYHPLRPTANKWDRETPAGRHPMNRKLVWWSYGLMPLPRLLTGFMMLGCEMLIALLRHSTHLCVCAHHDVCSFFLRLFCGFYNRCNHLASTHQQQQELFLFKYLRI